jgi:hypothetical protein
MILKLLGMILAFLVTFTLKFFALIYLQLLKRKIFNNGESPHWKRSFALLPCDTMDAGRVWLKPIWLRRFGYGRWMGLTCPFYDFYRYRSES